jgi:hypothetical protein
MHCYVYQNDYELLRRQERPMLKEDGTASMMLESQTENTRWMNVIGFANRSSYWGGTGQPAGDKSLTRPCNVDVNWLSDGDSQCETG